MGAGSPRALLGVDVLDILTLNKCAFVTAESLLGELVYALIGRRTTSLDHVEDTTLVWCQPGDFPRNRTAKRNAFPFRLRGII